MPSYVGECGSCGKVSEFYFGSGDRKKCSCPECGSRFDLDGNRRYDLEGLQISGDTCSNSHDFSGYDEGLGEYVTSRSHRKRIMDEKGLVEYSPDPTMKHHRDEARYIRANAVPGDPSAAAAVRNEHKAAADKRRTRLIDETFKKAKI